MVTYHHGPLTCYFYKMSPHMRSVLSLFRALIPTWNFFDEISAGSQVFFRSKEKEEWGEWRPLFASRPRHLGHLFINPQTNYQLLAQNAFDRLLSESQEYLEKPKSFSQSLSYQLCSRIARDEIQDACEGLEFSYYQFKIQARLMDSDHAQKQDAFVSEEIPR